MKDVDIKQLSQSEIERLGINDWPIWEKEVSEFPWTYDSIEECYILEGEVYVHSAQSRYHIKPGDFVTFAQGLSCKWEVIKPVRKHYNFK
jgi:uncharacterized cupin superfamily protein